MGRQAQPTPRQPQLEARHGALCGTRREVRKTFYRSLRVRAQQITSPIQLRWMEGPDLRSRGRLTPIGLVQGHLMVQPPVAPITQPRPKATTERRNIHCSRPRMDIQGLAPYTYRDGLRGINCRAPSKLVPTRASGATRYDKQSSLGRHCIPSSLPA
jgi:hypothetical protein